MRIAILPARGGSKRIPRKNIKSFNGIPLIAYSILEAEASGLFDHIVVSTEDSEIASLSREFGAETPFLRPANLADDFTGTVAVIAQGIQACLSIGWEFKEVCCIYPGAPFLQRQDLKQTLKLLLTSRADYCFPVTEFPSPVQRALKRDSDGSMKPIYPQFESARSQDLEPAYHDAGQFYWGKTEAWMNNLSLHSGGIGHVIPNWRVVDIDTPDDWVRAEMIHKSYLLMEEQKRLLPD